MPGTVTVTPTGNQDTDSLLFGSRWDTLNLTFSFPTSGSFYGTTYGSGEHTNGFEVLNATQQAATRRILDMFEAVTNLNFTEITETATQHADFRLAMTASAGTAFAYFPTSAQEGGDSWYNNSGIYDTPIQGNYAYTTFIHELGHNLGLKHGHENSPRLTAPHDSMEYSVMTYASHINDDYTGYTNETWGYAQTLMQVDIAALQHMYGADYTTNGTDTVYRWDANTGQMSLNGVGQGAPGGNRIFMTTWDGGGRDTYDFSNYATNLTVDLRPGEWTTTSTVQLANLGEGFIARGNIANALLFQGDIRSLIENATGGTGNDALTGNEVGNVLRGGIGNDSLDGSGGRDNLQGGAGLDTFEFNEAVRPSSIDRIIDWNAAQDTIELARSIFRALPAGTTLADAAFKNLSLGAVDATDRIIYDPSTGALSYDVDGSGAIAARQFATIVNKGALTAADFRITTGTTPPPSGDDYADTPADTTSPRGSVPIGTLRTGNLETAGDRDVFAVNLAAGQTYTFTLRGSATSGGTVADPYLRLLDGAGTQVTFDDDGGDGLDSRIEFTAATGGTYFLQAGEFGDNGTGTYTIRAVSGIGGAPAVEDPFQPPVAAAADVLF